MPQFDVTTFPSQIFWLAICFAILCTFMAMHLAPRLTKTLEARAHRLQEDWEQAKNLNAEIESIRMENRVRLRESQEKAHRLIHQASEKSLKTKSTRLKALDAELGAKMHQVRANMEQDKQAVRDSMAMIVSHVVTTAAPRILGQSVIRSQVTPIVEAVLKKRGQS